MNAKKLIIIDPTKIHDYRHLVKKEKWKWLFLGTDSCLREKVICKLGSKARYCYAAELQEVSLSKKDSFLDWISKIGMEINTTTWWATNTAYKSPLTCDLFLNYCYLNLIKEWLRNSKDSKLIVIENPWLIKSCITSFKGNGVHVETSTSYYLKGQIKRQLFSMLRLTYHLLRMFMLWLMNKMHFSKDKAGIDLFSTLGQNIFICTWIEARSFEYERKRFKDVYLGALHEYYKSKGYKIITLAMPSLSKKLLQRAYLYQGILPLIYFVSLSDILKSLFMAINSIYSKKTTFKHSGLNIKELLDFEFINEKGTVFLSYINYKSFIKFFNSADFQTPFLFYPFENQPWEKMMILACEKSSNNWNLIGCHTIGVPFFYLNFYLGSYESKQRPQPNIIASNGSHWKEVLINNGFNCKVKNGGSLRFGSNQKKVVSNTVTTRHKDSDDRVLVLLSTSLEYSLYLLFYLLRNNEKSKTYFIKPHPDTSTKLIIKKVGNIPDNFEFVSGPIDDWMPKVKWTIHVGTTAAIECMLRGIKVYKFIPERIDLDPLLQSGFKQDCIKSCDYFKFNNENMYEVPERQLIAEDFNMRTWDEILKNN